MLFWPSVPLSIHEELHSQAEQEHQLPRQFSSQIQAFQPTTLLAHTTLPPDRFAPIIYMAGMR